MSDSVRHHRRQPTRLPCPWDSPGKNTGVGCHFLLQCMKAKSESEVPQSSLTLNDPLDCSLPGSSVHGIFQVRVLEWGAIAFSGKYAYMRIKVQSILNSPFSAPWGFWFFFFWSPIRLLGLPGYIRLRPDSTGLCPSSSLNQRTGTSCGNWE